MAIKPKPQYSDGRWVSSRARKTNSEQHKAMHSSGRNGNHGARYFKSLSLPPPLMYARRNLYCARAITIQVTVPDMPLTAISTMNRVSAATKLVISDTSAKHRVMLRARNGTPRELNGDRLLGA